MAMGDGNGIQVLDIVLFALVAGFLVLRLRSVLGRRDGHRPAQRTDPFVEEAPGEDTVVRLPNRPGRKAPEDEAEDTHEEEGAAPAGSVEAGLTQIRIADPRFEPDGFVSGSRIAFELILNAFALGDAATLNPLLSEDVYANFVQSIREREQAGQTLETQLVGIQSAEITDAAMLGRTAHVTVRFLSQQVRVMRDANGAVVEGDLQAVSDVVDVWTFARDTGSTDPNWILVATGSPE